jgi:hypothetical protein
MNCDCHLSWRNAEIASGFALAMKIGKEKNIGVTRAVAAGKICP